MSELKMPVLGFPGGILQIVQPLPPSPNERYRRDFRTEHDLIRYLSENGARLFDPYAHSSVEAVH